MKSATKKCQTCTKRLPRDGPPCCPGKCKEKYDKRRAKRRAKPEHKEYHRLNRQTSGYKAMKKKSAAKFNATEKGRIVKRRSDKVYYATANGNLRRRMQKRFSEVMNTAAKGSSGKLEKYCSMSTTAELLHWASQFGTKEENKLKHIDHIIPVAAFAWKWEDDECHTLVRCDIPDDDLKRLWHEDNLALIGAVPNMQKGCQIVDDATLLKIRHCWPSYWKDCFPTEEAKKRVAWASRRNVRILEF